MKRILLFSLVLSFFSTAQAQFVEVSYGSNYTQQVYYNLNDDSETALAIGDWDIALSTDRDGAIHLNEAAPIQSDGLQLFFSPTADFADNIDPNILTPDLQLFNPDDSWSEGAFNTIKQPGNPFDFGWGAYDPMTNAVNGKAIFGLKLRDGSFKKMMVESFDRGVYSIKMADLDGANEQTFAVNLMNSPGQRFVYFSFEKNATAAVPNQFDLLFTRYFSPADNGQGDTLDYSVSGVLSGYNTEVAVADGVDVTTVDFNDYSNALSPQMDQIGFDWKEIDLGTFEWEVTPNKAYFVKTAGDTIWKIVFIDFQGASTGNTTFEKTFIGALTSVGDIESAFSTFNVFPNPVVDEATIAFTLKKSNNLNLTLTNVGGQQVWNRTAKANEGFNVITLPNLNLTTGTYFLNLITDSGEVVSKKISVQ